MQMPGMDGVQLLALVKDIYPDTVRLMLTGNADQETAVEAVNKGQIFRFLSKPCSTAVLAPALALALRQYQLLTGEKELLDETLNGSVSVMSELLTLADATSFSLGPRIKPLVRKLAAKLELSSIWQYEISACMSQLGCITLPSEILHKVHSGLSLSDEEWQTYRKHPETGARLISQIPRLEKVSEMIFLQLQDYDSFDSGIDDDVALGAQILKVVIEYDLLRQQGVHHVAAVKILRKKKTIYNPEIVAFLAGMKPKEGGVEVRSLSFREIMAGMVADEDVFAKNGALLIPKDQKISWAIIESLTNFEKHVGIEEPIRVRVTMVP